MSHQPEFDATRTQHSDSTLERSRPDLGAAAGATFRGFRILRLLGEGGMGAVYEAEEAETGRIVALKLARPSVSMDAAERDRLLNEARLAASISHPNCVFVYGSHQDGEGIAIAMEMVRGHTVKDVVERFGAMSVDRAVQCTLDILAGLEAAHEKGVLHRDIKPANVFVDQLTGQAKVGDFGLSLSYTATELKKGSKSFAGTPAYASPEQLQGSPLEHRSDIYSAAATLYYMLTGRAPFIEVDIIQLVASIAGRMPEPPSQWNTAVKPELDAVVLRALAKKPDERFPDYASFRAALVPEPAAPLPRRLAAGMIDAALTATSLAANLAAGISPASPLGHVVEDVSSIILYTSFGAMEGHLGFTPGKWLYGLRVRRGLRNAGWRAGLWRGFLFALLQNGLAFGAGLASGHALGWRFKLDLQAGAWTTAIMLMEFAGVAIAFLTARSANGWQGLHDRLSGTRVTRVSRSGAGLSKLEPVQRVDPSASRPAGPFLVAAEAASPGVAVAWDPILERNVWLVEHAPGTPPLPTARRETIRRGALRWIGGLRTSAKAWDAFEYPGGGPLLGYRRIDEVGQLATLLADLAAELPPEAENLDLRRVWIAGDHGVVCDFPVASEPMIAPLESGAPAFLRRCASEALSHGSSIPLPVGEVLGDLERGTLNLAEASSRLRSLAESGGCTVTRVRRLVQMLVGNWAPASLAAVVAVDFALGPSWRGFRELREIPMFFAGLSIAAGLLFTAATGAPLSMSMTGLAFTDRNGARAPRWRALARLALPLLIWLAILFAVLQHESSKLSPLSAQGDVFQQFGKRLGAASREMGWAFGSYWLLVIPQWLFALRTPSRGILERITGLWISRT
ncbi:MAG: hypothetical protein FJW30_03460 [Acidobacteria bacterium]|nr:hypothetical protein [Acidobacteriota bacterium]